MNSIPRTILTISTDRYAKEKRKILDTGQRAFSTSKDQQHLDELKADIFNAILKVKELYLYPPLKLNVSTSSHAITDVTQVVFWFDVMTHRTFAQCMRDADFVNGLSDFRRHLIFPASYAEHEIESLMDKNHSTTLEDNYKLISEEELSQRIESLNLPYVTHHLYPYYPYLQKGLMKTTYVKGAHLLATSITSLKSIYATSHGWINPRVHSVMVTRDTTVSQKLHSVDIKTLENAYRTWITEGETMQMLDGLSLRALDPDFLSKVLASIMTDPNRQLLAKSVIGLESSVQRECICHIAILCLTDSQLTSLYWIQGIGSTAQKYITRRTSFDKKITLLALMVRKSSSLIPNIRTSLEEMFRQIPGCTEDLDFMTIEQKDVHLLVNAFSSFNDDFRPRAEIISESKNIHVPAASLYQFTCEILAAENETFPIKVSNLRQALLASAVDSAYDPDTKMFDNVNGVVSSTSMTLKKSKSGMRCQKYSKEFNTIPERITPRDEALLEFNQQAAISKQDSVKRNGNTKKNTYNNTVEDFGQQIKFNSSFGSVESDQLFNDTWKNVEQSHENFMKSIGNTNQLEKLVNSFNEAIKGGQSTVNSQNPGFEQKFNRKFWVSLEMPATLATEGIVVNYDIVASLIVVKPHGIKRTIKNALNNSADVDSVRPDSTQKFSKRSKKITNKICTEIKIDKSMQIEYGKTHSWLQRLCDGLFNVVGNLSHSQTEFLPQINNFNPIETRLRKHADQIIEAKWDTLEGCTARCPTCDSKCEDIKGTRHTHRTSAHVITAFGGYRNVHSRETGLVVCSEKAAHESLWKKPKDVADSEIRNMRGVWWHLREEWCEKYGMKEITPADWNFNDPIRYRKNSQPSSPSEKESSSSEETSPEDLEDAMVELTIWCPDERFNEKNQSNEAGGDVERRNRRKLANKEPTKSTSKIMKPQMKDKLRPGDKIVQDIYLQLAKIEELFPVDSHEELEETTQGDQGFGSTDRPVIINYL
ncbi:5208_t:CDS:10 [Ambispora gerdemannii]|uniref:5208_t:CDS:1 n=1 Tax=Ambispora gerdemannii TaxID=144530 RepID=A0A9N9F6G8_9GLOM|nr:5208_t:CDS:10 [Ambispora gerdemannii]